MKPPRLDAPTTLSTQPLSELQPAPPGSDLRAEFVDAYGPRVFLALAAVGALFLLPFAINSFLEGRALAGAATALLAVCLLANATALAFGRPSPFAPAFVFAPAVVALVVAMWQQGLVGILWGYAALLLFHFGMGRQAANVFNALVVALATLMAWMHLGDAVAVRVAATMALTVLLVNIFTGVADAQRRKEAEHRRRLDLLVRGTHAGTLECTADGRQYFSPRLREMLGLAAQGPGRDWQLLDFVHAEDRDGVAAALREPFRESAGQRAMVEQPPADHRLVHMDGHTLWVHCEGIAVTDRRGRARRCVWSFIDISERVLAQKALLESHEQVRQQARQLEAQNVALREAIRVREEVERIARHDLKTPLASIASVPRLLRQERTPGPREEELLGLVERAALRVLSMVNLSLDLHRMEEGTYPLRAEAVDVGALLRSVAADLEGHADSKRVRLVLDLPAAPLLAHGEELLCYSILANLMKNAVEAAPEDSVVRCWLEGGRWGGGEAVVLHIHNEGAVPQAVRARFFQKYATHGKPGGSGLGAYSALQMAQVQGGELHMATGDDEGTTLTVWLRAAPERARIAPIEVTDGARGRASAPEAWPALSVLLVDDEPYNLLVLRRQLPEPPLVLREAINGRAALERVAEARPDVVFLDLQMPVMGGIEAAGLIRQMQADRGERPSVLVAFTARDDDGVREECRKTGFDHYLVKPASREQLLAVLQGRAPAPGRIAVLPNDDYTQALMPRFIASRRQLLRNLCDAAGRGERERVRTTAHKLAGSFGMYGFAAAGELSREIEMAAPSQDLGWLQSRCVELTAQFEKEAVATAPR